MDRLIESFPSVYQTAVAATSQSEWGIEGSRSQEFSVGIFIFLIICIFVFVLVILHAMITGKKSGRGLKMGEKIMFGWIFFGVIVAIIMGTMQILYGNLL